MKYEITSEQYLAIIHFLEKMSYCPKGAEKSYPEAAEAKKILDMLEKY